MNDHAFGVYVMPRKIHKALGTRRIQMNRDPEFWEAPLYEGDDGQIAHKVAEFAKQFLSDEYQVALVSFLLWGGGQYIHTGQGELTPDQLHEEAIEMITGGSA